MKKKQLKDELKAVISKYEEESGFKVDWIKVNRKKAVGFSLPDKDITISVKFRSI